MFDRIDKCLRGIGYVVLAVLVVFACLMLGITWVHIFCRYALNDSLSWSEELLKFLVVWFCLLSATFISLRREHVRIVIFKQMLPRATEKMMDYLVSFLMFAIGIMMFYIGIRLSLWAGVRKTPALRIPFFYLYSSIYVAFGIIALYELRNFLVDIFAPGRPPALVDPAPALDAQAGEVVIEKV